ncbi:TIMELESS-interacting protein [Sarotherodon galilaeus]
MASHARVMFLVDTCACLPLTILLLVLSCRAIKRGQVPVIYYTNLLITTLLQLFTMIAFVANPDQFKFNSPSVSCYAISMMANLGFKICISLEGSSIIVFRQLDSIRKTMISVLACAVIWVICILTISLAADKEFIVCILAILHAPLYILCLVGTLKRLPAATSVPVKEKRRIVGAVVLLFVNYFVMISPMIVLIFHIRSYMLNHIPYIITHSTDVIMTLFLLSPFADLILFVFMCDWFTDKLVASLCCCIKDDSTPSTV